MTAADLATLLAALLSLAGLVIAALGALLVKAGRAEAAAWALADARNRALHAEIRRSQSFAAQIEREHPINGQTIATGDSQ